jgi:hypothetical protein
VSRDIRLGIRAIRRAGPRRDISAHLTASGVRGPPRSQARTASAPSDGRSASGTATARASTRSCDVLSKECLRAQSSSCTTETAITRTAIACRPRPPSPTSSTA